MIEPETVGIFGLGLIGGSIARDLSAQGVRVLGYDANPESLRRAIDEGSVEVAIDANSERLAEAEVVILAVPVDAAADLLARIAPRLKSARLVTDVGSTKAAIARVADESGVGTRFVGSHPLCGDHRSGYSASRRGLFQGATVFICLSEAPGEGATNLAAELWARLGAHTVSIAPAEHDRVMSWMSHLPQITATALALTLNEVGLTRRDLGPGGLEMTRLAGSSPEMWSAILRENRDNAVIAVTGLINQLERLRSHIAEGDSDALAQRLGDSQAWAMSHIPCKGESATQM